MEEEIISNRFEGYLFNNVYEWVCIHDEDIHFPHWNPLVPGIKLCSSSLRVRANDAWTKLPRWIKEVMVAHEIGHRELQHYLQAGMLYRLLAMATNQPPVNEIAADKFACKLVPKETVPRCLSYLMDRAEDIAVKSEYIHRIQALRL